MVVFPLKCMCMPYLLHMCSILSAVPLVYGMTIWPVDLLVVLALVLVLVGLLLFVVLLFSSLVLCCCCCLWPCILLVVVNNFILHPANGPVGIFSLAKGFP